MRAAPASYWSATSRRSHSCLRRGELGVSFQEGGVGAGCPKVRFSYAPQPGSRLGIGGRVLGEGEVLSPAGPVTIEIEGVGTIEIDPAVSEDTASDRADLQVHRETL